MDVDVHGVEGHIEIDDAGRELADHDSALARLADRRHRGLADHEAVIDKEILHIAVGAGVLGTADKARDVHAAEGVVHGDQLAGEIPAVDGIDRREQLAVARGTQDVFGVFDIGERDLGVRQRDLVDHIGYGVALRHIGFEELHAGRHVVEQITDDEGGAVGTARVLKEHLFPALDQIAGTELLLARLGDQLEVRDRRNARERLTSESEGRDRVEVILNLHLGGRMTDERGADIVL